MVGTWNVIKVVREGAGARLVQAVGPADRLCLGAERLDLYFAPDSFMNRNEMIRPGQDLQSDVATCRKMIYRVNVEEISEQSLVVAVMLLIDSNPFSV